MTGTKTIVCNTVRYALAMADTLRDVYGLPCIHVRATGEWKNAWGKRVQHGFEVAALDVAGNAVTAMTRKGHMARYIPAGPVHIAVVGAATPEDLSADAVTITRERNYPTVAHPGAAWVWLYTVVVPGLVTMRGTGIGWARRMATRYADGRRIIESWSGGAS